MATLLLAAAGAAIGSGVGGTVLGLTGAVIGRAVGATIGRVIDQQVLGLGSEAIEVGRVDRFRVMGASEGAAIPRLWGRIRVSGQVIWASRFVENVHRAGGGKGSSRRSIKQYDYTVSLAVAICEGEILRLGRIWADGNEIEPDALNLRLYKGSDSQLPDGKIEAVEGAGQAPAYRGIAYVVIEDLDLSAYGNRVPQFSFEVVRAPQGAAAARHPGLAQVIPGVCLIPGTGEYALATTPVHYALGLGRKRSANVNTIAGISDFSLSLQQLTEELPGAGMVSLVVSWFGDDLRCGACAVRPKVEQKLNDGVGMAWNVSGLTRAMAEEVPKAEGRALYGGTPTDRSVVEAITALRAAGRKITFYPFLLMEQTAGNSLPDPWTGATGQPALPWRGRITLSAAPGRPGSPDTTAGANAEVAAFFGTAAPADFTVSGQSVDYTGPDDWHYRRFILHYAHLCAAAGGVDAFCIGSELRGLTQARGPANSFPTVAALRQLAADVRAILGPATKLTYAADWSEYFGYHTGGDVFFHLDPLWSDANIDFIGIDNYLPLSDWRDGAGHADAGWGDLGNPDYLAANVAGGEGFDWYYPDDAARAAQARLPISDGAHGEDWVFRPKDLKGWWSSSHHNREGGVRAALPTGWIAGSKPIRFTEFGCAALDKATNQPNLFLDAKSSESALPTGSSGLRDDLVQLGYYRAQHAHWTDPAKNPEAQLYDGHMVDFASSTAWAWDARPFPAFPAHTELWSDGGNYDRGHWLNGRAGAAPLAAVIAEVMETAGVASFDTSGARGLVRGYAVNEVTSGRAILQPLTLASPTDVVERDGVLQIRARRAEIAAWLEAGALAISADLQGPTERARAGAVDTPTELRLSFHEAEADFAVTTVSATAPEDTGAGVAQTDLPLVLLPAEARAMAERWMAETRIGRETLRLALPPSQLGLGVGDTLALAGETFRIDRLEQTALQTIDAVRVEASVYHPVAAPALRRVWQPVLAGLPVYPLLLDLPRLREGEAEHAPYACVAADPWPGPVALWDAASDADYQLNRRFEAPAVLGQTLNDLAAAPPGRWDRGPALRVRLEGGALASVPELALLGGANTALIGDGSTGTWEVFQFQNATLVAPDTWDLGLRLRGQLGSDAAMPTLWPAGSHFLLVDEAVQQIDLSLSARGLARFYRFGPAAKGYEAANTVLVTAACEAAGLRPWRVAHLAARRAGSGDLALTWVRRTRIDGDSWQAVEVPLGEAVEAYQVTVRAGTTLLRQTTVATSDWSYSAAAQAADGASGAITFEVAQLSQAFGAGPAASLTLTL